jgi:hypothetical protein
VPDASEGACARTLLALSMSSIVVVQRARGTTGHIEYVPAHASWPVFDAKLYQYTSYRGVIKRRTETSSGKIRVHYIKAVRSTNLQDSFFYFITSLRPTEAPRWAVLSVIVL